MQKKIVKYLKQNILRRQIKFHDILLFFVPYFFYTFVSLFKKIV
jgi:hypothetical protein